MPPLPMGICLPSSVYRIPDVSRDLLPLLPELAATGADTDLSGTSTTDGFAAGAGAGTGAAAAGVDLTGAGDGAGCGAGIDLNGSDFIAFSTWSCIDS